MKFNKTTFVQNCKFVKKFFERKTPKKIGKIILFWNFEKKIRAPFVSNYFLNLYSLSLKLEDIKILAKFLRWKLIKHLHKIVNLEKKTFFKKYLKNLCFYFLAVVSRKKKFSANLLIYYDRADIYLSFAIFRISQPIL